MFDKMKFRMVAPHVDVMAKGIADTLKRCGFEVYDVLESEIVKNPDNTKVSEVYILCCKGRKRAYKAFKESYKLDEIVYEGVKTLI